MFVVFGVGVMGWFGGFLNEVGRYEVFLCFVVVVDRGGVGVMVVFVWVLIVWVEVLLVEGFWVVYC